MSATIDEKQDGDQLLRTFLQLMDRHRVALCAIVLTMHLAAFNGQWRVGPDSSAYATIARNVVDGRGYTHPEGLEKSVHPALIYMLIANFRMMGTDTMWPAVLFIHLTGLAALVLVYRLFLLHTDRPTAVTVTLMVATCSIFFRHCLDVLNDVPFLLGMCILLFGHERLCQRTGAIWLNVCLIAFGLAWMAGFRIVFLNVALALLIVGVWTAMRSRHRWPAISLTGLVIAVVATLRILDPRGGSGLSPREESIIYQLTVHLKETLQLLPENLLILIEDVMPSALVGNTIAPGIDSLLTIAVIVSGVALARRRPLWGILVVGFVLQWLLFVMVPRYVLAVIPLLAYAWWMLAFTASRRLPKRWGRVVFVTLMILWFGMNMARSVGFVIEQRRVPFLEHYRHGRYAGLKQLGLEADRILERDAVIVTIERTSGPLSFWSRRTCYPADRLPDIRPGVKVYVVSPFRDAFTELMNERAWRVGPTLVEIARHGDTPPLQLSPVFNSQ